MDDINKHIEVIEQIFRGKYDKNRQNQRIIEKRMALYKFYWSQEDKDFYNNPAKDHRDIFKDKKIVTEIWRDPTYQEICAMYILEGYDKKFDSKKSSLINYIITFIDSKLSNLIEKKRNERRYEKMSATDKLFFNRQRCNRTGSQDLMDRVVQADASELDNDFSDSNDLDELLDQLHASGLTLDDIDALEQK